MSQEVVKQSSLKVADIAVSAIDPNPNNTNEMSDEAFGRLVEEIKENGFIVPILVVPMENGRYKILNGEHRWKAATTVGYEHIPSVILSDEKWADPELFELVNIRINQIHGNDSPVKMQPIYDRVAAKYGEENVRRILGYTNEDIYKKLIKKMATGFKKNVSDDTAQKIDAEAAKSKDTVSFGRAVSKIIRDEAERSQQSHCLIFQSTGKNHVVIKASETTFSAISEIVRMCQHSQKDINTILLPMFSDVLQKAQEIFPDKSIEIPKEGSSHP